MAIIDKPSNFFNTKLYTGNGASSHAITGVGFKPDWTWNKNRSSAVNHALTDVVRAAPKKIVSNNNEVEVNQTTGLLSFNSDGFTVGSDSGYNGNGNSMVSWNWIAGGSQGSSNTAGSINTTYTSVNTTSGFSISSYTGNGSAGATVGHGLGAAPQMIIVKKLNGGGADWMVYHKSLGATASNLGKTKYLSLNTTAAEDNGHWNDTAPTSTVFSISSDQRVNSSGANYIAYCFAEKTSYNKFNKYTGNGNADGPFIYTGFKPAFVMFKKSSATGNWFMMNNKMFPANGINASGGDQKYLFANTSNNEQGGYGQTDILSNGFKFRGSDGDLNGSGVTYIYMAFAENPFVASNFVPATAR